MPTLKHSEITRYSAQQIFDLVADVASYPQFLPWCKGARILKKESDTVFLVELIIGFKGLTERYSSRVTLAPNDTIKAEMVDGPFHHLINDWRFIEKAEGCQIELELDFQFKSKLLEGMIGGLFSKASEKMVSAFRARARELYA
ncbi:MAG: type II toxin-antitoxin system RatA family toxin [Rickettsiales bacterium]|nr:type II toxin-antitoxin system RatA family toxin [Rickettsiales bacterium]